MSSSKNNTTYKKTSFLAGNNTEFINEFYLDYLSDPQAILELSRASLTTTNDLRYEIVVKQNLGSETLIDLLFLPQRDFLKKANSNQESDKLGWGMEVPFGPFLGLAGLFYFLGLQAFVDSWFEGIISNFIFVFSTL